jgi:hypothetical protein
LIALAVSPFIYRVIIELDVYVPLPIKIFGATTEKNHECRVKEKLGSWMMYFWRQENGETGGELSDD